MLRRLRPGTGRRGARRAKPPRARASDAPPHRPCLLQLAPFAPCPWPLAAPQVRGAVGKLTQGGDAGGDAAAPEHCPIPAEGVPADELVAQVAKMRAGETAAPGGKAFAYLYFTSEVRCKARGGGQAHAPAP